MSNLHILLKSFCLDQEGISKKKKNLMSGDLVRF